MPGIVSEPGKHKEAIMRPTKRRITRDKQGGREGGKFVP